MASIDDRVVEMTFRSESFLSGAAKVLQSIAMLKSSLNNLHGGTTFDELNAAARKTDLGHIASAVDSIHSKLSGLKLAATAAFAGLATSAAFAGLRVVKAFTIDPIKAGLDVYQTKINAIKTILANTASEGTNLKQVTAALDELNVYANKTVYNFGEMAKNIGTFTAAGVNLKTSVASIKGIANLAALSGSTSEQASTAMYQLSQAIAAGTVKLQDWNSVVNAGMGGKVFQTALENTARAMGVHIDTIIKKAGSFRNSLQQGWLSAKILTATLSQFTGDLSTQQLKAMGFTNKEALAIEKQAKLAVSSATQIRTTTQLFQALKEEVATAWSHVFEAIFGNINEATSTLTALHNTLETAFTSPINSLAKLLEAFRKLGGFDLIIQALQTAFHNLASVMHVVGEAFHAVFPSNGGSAAQGLIKIAIAFNNFMTALTPSAHTLDLLRTIFTGLFSAVKIVIDVIKGVATALFGIGSSAKGAGGGILELVAKVAQFITNVKNAIESGTAFTTFFKALGAIISLPIKALGALIGLFTGVGAAAGKAVNPLKSFFGFIVGAFSKLGDAIAKGISSGNISNVLAILNQGLFAAILLAIKKFIGGLGDKLSLGGAGAGFIDKIKGVFEALTGSLQSMQRLVNSQTLRNIAIAVGILAASLIGLSLVNPARLASGIAAMTGLFTQLIGAMAVVAKISPVGIAQMFAVVAALNLLATAIAILSGAVAILAHFSWEQLAKGLSGVAVSLALFVATAKLLSKSSGQLIAAAFSMDLIAVALNLMAGAIKILATMDWQSLAKGVATIAALLAIMAGFARFSGPQMIAVGAGLVLVGAGLNVLALAIKQLGSLSISELAKGLVSVAAGLVIIAGAMTLMPPNLILTGAGLIVVASALTILGGALKIMGSMSWSEVAKSLVELAGALVILAAGLALMTGALPGAAALVVVAAGLAILTPTLIALGNIGWITLLSALGALAAVLVVLGAAGILLAPLVPAILGLGAALVVFGAGIVAIGGGIALLGIGLTAIGAAVTTSGLGIIKFVKGVLSLIPFALKKIAEGIAAFAGGIAKSGGAIIKAFASILIDLSDAVVRALPRMNRAFIAILTTILNDINKYAPRTARTFANLLFLILSTIASNIGRFVNKGADIIVGFLRGISSNMGRVIRAGVTAVVSFINGVASNIGRIVNAAINLAIRFVNALAGGIRSHTGEIRSAAYSLGSSIIQGAIAGISGLVGGLIGAAVGAARSAISSMWHAIRGNSPSKETIPIGESLMTGIMGGINANKAGVSKTAADAAKGVIATLSDSLAAINSSTGVLTPTITPVVDLSTVKKGFDDLTAMAAALKPTTTIASAQFVSRTNQPTQTQNGHINAGTVLQFTQNNSSPKALSAAEIYRQTKNQLSVVKGALPS